MAQSLQKPLKHGISLLASPVPPVPLPLRVVHPDLRWPAGSARIRSEAAKSHAKTDATSDAKPDAVRAVRAAPARD